MHTRVVKNTTNRPLSISDITLHGVTLPPRTKVNLLKYATLDKISASADLEEAISNGLVVIYDDSGKQLSRQDGLDYVQSQQKGATTGSTGSTAKLDDLTDVTISYPGKFAPLVYNPSSAEWVNYIPPSGSINRTDGNISSVELGNGVTWTFSRDGDGNIQTITNGQKTWSFTRNGNGQIESWTVS